MSNDTPPRLTPTDANADPDVVQLKQLHDQATQTATRAIELGIQIGEILTRRRAEFPRRAAKGEGFGEWVQNNLTFSKRMAWGYIRAYHDRERLLAIPGATMRMVLGVGPETATITNDDDANDPSNKIVEGKTTPAQEKRAKAMAQYLGVTVAKARAYILATAPKPRDRNTDAEPSLAKRTIRVPTDTDTLIGHVARTTNRTYAVVALELFEIGRKRFVTRYNLNP